MKKEEQKQGMALFQGKEVRKTIYQKNGGFLLWMLLKY